jgi:hypothetical protein
MIKKCGVRLENGEYDYLKKQMKAGELLFKHYDKTNHYCLVIDSKHFEGLKNFLPSLFPEYYSIDFDKAITKFGKDYPILVELKHILQEDSQ